MSKPRKKSTIIPVRQVWQFQKPKDSCQFINVEHDIIKGWKILGRKDNKEFVFKGYVNPEDLGNAKDVINLLNDALTFIEGNMRKEKK